MSSVPVQPRPGREFTLSAVDVGWKLYSTRRYFTGNDPELHDPIGGTCVEIIHDSRIDDQTGEISEATRYRCLCTWRPTDPWQTLAADEIDTGQLYGLDRHSCAIAIRWLLRQIRLDKRSWLTSDELSCLRDAWNLAKAAAAL